jgi:hypothetical protein
MRVLKIDEELQLVYGEVYSPGVPDAHGDFMTETTIRKMAHGFLENMRVAKIDTNHDHELVDAVVVESFLAREGDPDFIPGSWVAGVHIKDPEVWASVKKGELNGFSIDGKAVGSITEIEIEVPDFVEGRTTKSEANGHSHRFKVHLEEDGTLIGGVTDEVLGHKHEIKRGTVTEEAEGHVHRFSFVELLTGHVNEEAA